jgi:hypothetical protein
MLTMLGFMVLVALAALLISLTDGDRSLEQRQQLGQAW